MKSQLISTPFSIVNIVNKEYCVTISGRQKKYNVPMVFCLQHNKKCTKEHMEP